MKKFITKKAFTLIELLIVITIIGLLATGWVSIYTTQLQWTRDALRISDIKIMESSAHQYYSAESEYPDETAFTWAIEEFVSKELKDPKHWDPLCWRNGDSQDQTCQGTYRVGDDEAWLSNWAFKLDVYFEKKSNYEKKADSDGGSFSDRFEVFAWWSGGLLSSGSWTVVY